MDLIPPAPLPHPTLSLAPVSASVGDAAERVVLETAKQAPVYSMVEVQEIMGKKNALLQVPDQTKPD